MFDLEKYIPRDETILFRFGISLRFIVVSSILWTLFLGGLAFFFNAPDQGASFLSNVLLTLLIVIIMLYIIRFLTTFYFVTETKIYKVVGLGFTKVTSAKQKEVDDMKIIQSFSEKVLFSSGMRNEK